MLDPRLPFEALAQDFPRGSVIAAHRHDRDQLLYAKRGVMRVTCDDGVWVVPPERALWMPAGKEHTIRCGTDVAMRTLYLGDEAARPTRCTVLAVTPLMREAMVALSERQPPSRAALIAVVQAELLAVDGVSLHLPEPADPRLVRICTRLRADPADSRPAAGWAGEAGMSLRTLLRKFLADTGMSFGAWRRQLRLLAALEMLAQGRPVTTVALDLGYQSPSAFTAAFRRALGVVPSRYFDGRRVNRRGAPLRRAPP